jgi:hypothetical protein
MTECASAVQDAWKAQSANLGPTGEQVLPTAWSTSIPTVWAVNGRYALTLADRAFPVERLHQPGLAGRQATAMS